MLFTFSLLLFTFAANVARAESIGEVEYWDADDEKMRKSDEDKTYLLTAETTTLSNDCWYVVEGEVTVNKTIQLEDEAHIILKDGAKLTVNGDGQYHPGILVRYSKSDNDDLHIWGQELGTGELIANGGDNAPGIGGGYMSDNYSESYQSGGHIYINGGHVTANGGNHAPGIGGAEHDDTPATHRGDLYLYGGHLVANGGAGAAGIGGTYKGAAPDDCVRIYGGELKVVGGEGAPAIGAGAGATDEEKKKLRGVEYEADFWVHMDGVSNFYEHCCNTFDVWDTYAWGESLTFEVEFKELIYDTEKLGRDRHYLHAIGGVRIPGHPGTMSHDKFYILDVRGEDYTVSADGSHDIANLSTIEVEGSANLFLAYGTLDLKGVYMKPALVAPSGSIVNIDGCWGILKATGCVEDYDDYVNGGLAGIGGSNGRGMGTVNIYGGTVIARGTEDTAAVVVDLVSGSVEMRVNSGGAGIGGSNGRGMGTVNIYGGTVIARGTEDTAAVVVDLVSGSVEMRVNSGGAGIGGDRYSVGGIVNIYGGHVTAVGGAGAAGIGGSSIQEGGFEAVNIYGGEVSAKTGGVEWRSVGPIPVLADDYGGAAGIGSGQKDYSCTGKVTIYGGKVEAVGDSGGAGIGGGYQSSCGAVVINGGEVSAYAKWGANVGTRDTGESYVKSHFVGCGIGRGYGGSSVPVAINDGTIKAEYEDAEYFEGVIDANRRFSGRMEVTEGSLDGKSVKLEGRNWVLSIKVPEGMTVSRVVGQKTTENPTVSNGVCKVIVRKGDTPRIFYEAIDSENYGFNREGQAGVLLGRITSECTIGEDVAPKLLSKPKFQG